MSERGPLRDLVRRLWCGSACYESALSYSLERRQFDQPIAGFQLTQRKLVEMMVAVQRTLVALHLGR